MNSRRKVPDLGALLVSLVVAAAAFYRTRAVGLVGWDTLPEIASSRIQNVADFLATFVERTAEGYYPFKFYRPVFNLSLALDYSIWGIEPIGYQLSSAILFGACGFALYRLARALLGVDSRGLGPWIVLAVFFSAPFHLEIVSVVSRRMDLLVGLFISLALTSQLHRCRGAMPRASLVPALFTLAAIGSKEIAVIVPPLVFLMVLLYGPRRSGRPPWRHAILAALPHVGAVALCVVVRFAAFGELGGHSTTRLGGAIDLLPPMLGRELVEQVVTSVGAGAALYGTIGAATLLASALLWGWLLFASGARLEGSERRALDTAAIALAWLVGSAGIFGTVGFMQVWYLLVPRQGFALLVGAVGQFLVGVVGNRRSAVSRIGAAAGLVVMIGLVIAQSALSPFLRNPTHWLQATRIANEYLADLRARIDAAPDASITPCPGPPMLVRVVDDRLGPAQMTVLTWYSVQAWADLVYADRDLVVLPRSPAAPPVMVVPTTRVIDLRPHDGRRAAASRARAQAGGDGRVQQQQGTDASSTKEALKQIREAIEQSRM